MAANKFDLDFYTRAYFYFDEPVEYQLKTSILHIYPVSVKDSEFFLMSVPVIDVDKNSLDSVEIIQMSYLEFLCKYLLKEEMNASRFLNIIRYCFHANEARFDFNDAGKIVLNLKFKDEQMPDVVISAKDFENIRKIILYQNIPNYDDSYVDPEAKAAMQELDELKSANLDMPTLERRIAIITAHCGIDKQTLMQYSIRSFQLLFEECAGEVEFTTVRPIALYAGKGNEIEHWIYRKKKNKFDDYFTSVGAYQEKFGGESGVKITNVSPDHSVGAIYDQQFNSFKKK